MAARAWGPGSRLRARDRVWARLLLLPLLPLPPLPRLLLLATPGAPLLRALVLLLVLLLVRVTVQVQRAPISLAPTRTLWPAAPLVGRARAVGEGGPSLVQKAVPGQTLMKLMPIGLTTHLRPLPLPLQTLLLRGLQAGVLVLGRMKAICLVLARGRSRTLAPSSPNPLLLSRRASCRSSRSSLPTAPLLLLPLALVAVAAGRWRR